ncbi:MAG: sulfur carrier protein ThiS [Granulosicoccus sp.]
MRLQINGDCQSVQIQTLEELLNHLGHEPHSVATAVNKDFVSIENRSTCLLEENDCVDIIAPMAGG